MPVVRVVNDKTSARIDYEKGADTPCSGSVWLAIDTDADGWFVSAYGKHIAFEEELYGSDLATYPLREGSRQDRWWELAIQAAVELFVESINTRHGWEPLDLYPEADVPEEENWYLAYVRTDSEAAAERAIFGEVLERGYSVEEARALLFLEGLQAPDAPDATV